MSKFNQTTVDLICKKIAEGNIQRDSAILAGIDEATFYRWLKNKKKYAWMGKASFASRVEASQLQYKEKLINIVNVKSTTEPSGRTALEMLARRFPEEFSEKRKLELSGELNVIPILGGKSVNAISGNDSDQENSGAS